MTDFKKADDLEQGKLYYVLLKNGEKRIVFRDKQGIRTNATLIEDFKNFVPKPVGIIKEESITKFEKIG